MGPGTRVRLGVGSAPWHGPRGDLACLAGPATSSELAAKLVPWLGAVGGHLAVLREVELVVGSRTDHRVVYYRTDAGEVLATGVAAMPDTGTTPGARPDGR